MADILVVEDDVSTCRTLERLFRIEGHEAHCVRSGREALLSVHDHVPQLVVLDVMLPDVTGIDVLRAMRADPRLDEVPVVVYTAVTDATAQAEAHRLGAAEFVIKGGGWAELYPHIARHLS